MPPIFFPHGHTGKYKAIHFMIYNSTAIFHGLEKWLRISLTSSGAVCRIMFFCGNRHEYR
jgi:hypothetical protein